MSLLAKKNVEVDVDSLKRIAGKLGIDLPDSDDPAELVPVMKKAFKKRLPKNKEEWIECPICGEMTDDVPEIDACPYCGDEGEGDEDEEAGLEADDGPMETAEVDDSAEPEEPPTVDVDADSDEEPQDSDEDGDGEEAEPEKAAKPEKAAAVVKTPKAKLSSGFETLKDCETVIDREKRNMTTAGYELGIALREVQSRDLWKEKKLSGFREFCEKNDISHTLAYGLIDLVNKFDREAFLKHGQTKLMIVAKADEKERAGLLKDAETKSTRELKDEVRERKSPGPSKSKTSAPPKEQREDGRGRPSKDDQTITLLAKVGGKPITLKFRDKETGQEIDEFNPDSYLDLRLSDDVAVLISLKVADDETTITGAVATFKRAKAKEKASKAEKAPRKRARSTDTKDKNGAKTSAGDKPKKKPGRPPGSKNKKTKQKEAEASAE